VTRDPAGDATHPPSIGGQRRRKGRSDRYRQPQDWDVTARLGELVRRVLQRLDPEELDRLVSDWLARGCDLPLCAAALGLLGAAG
jgi:hypothetical protein